MADHHSHKHDCLDGKHLILDELVCHFPYAVFSVAFSIIVLTILNFFTETFGVSTHATTPWFHMFHSFHFVHIVFAAAGSMITYSKFSKKIVRGFFVGLVSSSFFCVLSDILMPYVGARMLGVPMKLHICFVSELNNIIPFLLVGLLTGMLVTLHHREDENYSMGLWSHFTHIFVSSLASTFYMVSGGFVDWIDHVGMVFLLLVVAVVIPCTLSDVVVPIVFANMGRKNGKKRST